LENDQDLIIQTEVLKSQTKLISNIAHEINNPLMVISGRVELSLMDKLDEGIEENFKTIGQQANRVKDIVAKLLIFSKPAKVKLGSAQINDIIDALITSPGEEILSEGVVVTKNFDASLPEIEIDEKQIGECLINILQNSNEAMSKGGNLTISTSGDDAHICIEIKDTGCGIAQENITKVFEPFFTTKEDATGLGLSVCHGILRAHNGELTFESSAGGTTARLTLPKDAKL